MLREILLHGINFPLCWHQMKNTLKIILQTQDVSFIRYTSNVGETIQCQHGRRHFIPLELNFYVTNFISVFLEIIRKDEFSKKQLTSERMQHNVELFLSSETGHSPKRSVNILGRK